MRARDLHDPSALRVAIGLIRSEPDDENRNEQAYELGNALSKEWLLEDAIAVSSLLDEWCAERVVLLTGVAQKLASIGSKGRSHQILQEAKDVCMTMEPGWNRAESLLLVSRKQRETGDDAQAASTLSEAISEARSGQGRGRDQDELDCASVLWEAAEEIAIRGDVASATDLAREILNPRLRARALTRIGAIAIPQETEGR